MDALADSQKIYKPLRGSEIRVIKLNPLDRLDADAPVHATLAHVPLNETADFFALSYVWGDATHTETISLDGHNFPVTFNLWKALIYLRCHFKPGRRPRDTELPASLRLDADGPDNGWDGDAEHAAPWTEGQVCWWIDALCINQADLAERAEQVPRMRAIYSLATRTVIWLGAPVGLYTHPWEGKHGEFDRLCANVASAAERNHKVCAGLGASLSEIFKASEIPAPARRELAEELGPDLAELTDTMGRCIFLYVTKYFGRIWTLQEAVLPPVDPVVLLGSSQTTLRKLGLLYLGLKEVYRTPNFRAAIKRSLKIRLHMTHIRDTLIFAERLAADGGQLRSTVLGGADGSNHNNVVSGQLAHNLDSVSCSRSSSPAASVDDELRTFAAQLRWLLRTFNGGRLATNPRDRIYGLLGLATLPSRLPRELQPDYGQSFADVALGYAGFLVEWSGYLDVISLRPNGFQGYPSWVPDFTSTIFNLETPHTRSVVRLTGGGRCIVARGAQVGVVEAVHFEPLETEMGDGTDLDAAAQSKILSVWETFLATIIRPSAQAGGLAPRAVMEKFLENSALNEDDDKSGLLALLDAHEDFAAASAGAGSGPSKTTLPAAAAAPPVPDAQRSSCLQAAMACAPTLIRFFEHSIHLLLDNGYICVIVEQEYMEEEGGLSAWLPARGDRVVALRGTSELTVLRPLIGGQGRDGDGAGVGDGFRVLTSGCFGLCPKFISLTEIYFSEEAEFEREFAIW
ncbi:hypothetical protein RB595_007809 [Gaeumannomyces hyphopodioides]